MPRGKMSTPLLVPDEDLSLPLPDRRFPFRPAPAAQVGEARAKGEAEEARRAADRVLRGVDNMIYRAIRRRVTDYHRVEELAAECREHLWRYALPRYDQTTGNKPSTFLHVCVYNFVRGRVRDRLRAGKTTRPQTIRAGSLTDARAAEEGPIDRGLVARDESLDRRIERLAEDVRTHPEAYMPPQQARVLRALLDHPHTPMKDLARQLGYQNATSLSDILRRVVATLKELPLEDWEPGRATRPPARPGASSTRGKRLRAFLASHPDASIPEVVTALGYQSPAAARTALTHVRRHAAAARGGVDACAVAA